MICHEMQQNVFFTFFLMAYELEEPLAALMISSARHSAMVLMLRKAASRAPIVIKDKACRTVRKREGQEL